jgi:hypothetical protein
VVRVVDADRKDLAPRLGRDWSVAGLARTMSAGLVAANSRVPEWFTLFAAEQAARRRKLETAVYGMG